MPIAMSVATAKALPLMGRWSPDVTCIPAQERPRRVTIAFRVDRDGKWTILVDMVGPNETTWQTESTAALDAVAKDRKTRSSGRATPCPSWKQPISTASTNPAFTGSVQPRRAAA